LSPRKADAAGNIIIAMPKPDLSLLEAALVGYRQRRAEIAAKIAELEQRLGSDASGSLSEAPARRKKRRISAAGRRRIAEAQRKRWAAVRKKGAKK